MFVMFLHGRDSLLLRRITIAIHVHGHEGLVEGRKGMQVLDAEYPAGDNGAASTEAQELPQP